MASKRNDTYLNRKFEVSNFRRADFDFWKYLQVEMLGIGEPGQLEPPKKESVQNFLLVPFMLERLVFLGSIVCLDAFLYVVTFLPVRVCYSAVLLINEAFVVLFSGGALEVLSSLFLVTSGKKQRKTVDFHRTQVYDLMRGAMLLFGCLALSQINMSRLYHFIRGQSMIKLYVLTSMMEVMDKLLSSFGQDVFDTLHIQTRTNPTSSVLLAYFVVAVVYVIIHSGLHFLHVATLTVVINSADEALITVLILNNFSEMKSFVFKKFDSHNLFQLACSDIVERFQSVLFLFVIILVALAQAGSGWWEVLPVMLRVAAMMIAAECIIDGVKHAFINKFNGINALVYLDFGYVLRGDILTNQKDQIILDHTYTVTRRMGLSQIPLGCVCIRYVMLAASAPAVQMYFSQLSLNFAVLHFLCAFLLLLATKIFVGVGLVFYASSVREQDVSLLRSPVGKTPAPPTLASPRKPRPQLEINPDAAATSTSTTSGGSDPLAKTLFSEEEDSGQKLQERMVFMEELSGIERYTVYKGRIVG